MVALKHRKSFYKIFMQFFRYCFCFISFQRQTIVENSLFDVNIKIIIITFPPPLSSSFSPHFQLRCAVCEVVYICNTMGKCAMKEKKIDGLKIAQHNNSLNSNKNTQLTNKHNRP